MATDLRLFSLKDLFTKLHDDITAFIVDAKNALDRNSTVSFDEIKRVREHIVQKLNNGEDVEDNEALLKVLNLFTMDKAFLGIVSEESESWLDFLDAIEKSIKDFDKYASTEEERRDLKEIDDAISRARGLLRK